MEDALMEVAVAVEPGHVAAGGHGAAQPVEAHVELLEASQRRHLRRYGAADGVVAEVGVGELLRELHAGEVKVEGVAGHVEVLDDLLCAEEAGGVAGEGVAGEVDVGEVDSGELSRDGAGEVVVGELEVGAVGGLGQEERRDGAGEAVAAEVDTREADEVGEGRWDGAGEGVVGEVEEGECGERAEEGGHRAGHTRVGDCELREVGKRGEGVRDDTGDGREVVEGEGLKEGEVADGVRDGAGHVGVLVDTEADDAARVGITVDIIPVAAGGVGRPRREVVGAAHGDVDGNQGGMVIVVALVRHRHRNKEE
uniref:Uncharacterized protein n=1 Tax=Triticum urartu TaxID=4572 RepID=A0A8R7VBI8_TRIUA